MEGCGGFVVGPFLRSISRRGRRERIRAVESDQDFLREVVSRAKWTSNSASVTQPRR